MRRSRSVVPLLLRQYSTRPRGSTNGSLSIITTQCGGWTRRSSLAFSSQATLVTTSTPPDRPVDRHPSHVVVPPPRSDVPHKQKPTDLLPTRHSRNMLAPTCLDSVELQQLTDSLCRSTPGTLYRYVERPTTTSSPASSDSSTTSTSEQDEAWKVADLTIQKAEYIIRGHAARIPGTMWHRWWLVDDDNDYFETTTQQQQQQQSHHVQQTRDSIEHIIKIVDRLQQEGNLYIKLRHERLTQLAHERGESVSSTTTTTAVNNNNNKTITTKSLGEKVDSNEDDDDDDDDEEDKLKALAWEHPFAAPGPTVGMLDTLLDCFAVAAPDCPDLVTPEATAEVLTMILDRHLIDGGAEKNANPFTVPTLVSYNAFLRTMANLPYETAAVDNTTTTTSTKLRDQALYYSFGMYDTLRHSTYLSRNSATMTYMLGVVAKFFPPSRTRGNVAHGLWMHAVRQGLIDPHVMEALRVAHTPTNGPEFEAWSKVYLDGKQVRDLPQKLYKFAKVRRHLPREATY